MVVVAGLLKVVVVFTEPLYGNVVVYGGTIPSVEKVTTTTAYAVVSPVASTSFKEDVRTTVEKPVGSFGLLD